MEQTERWKRNDKVVVFVVVSRTGGTETLMLQGKLWNLMTVAF